MRRALSRQRTRTCTARVHNLPESRAWVQQHRRSINRQSQPPNRQIRPQTKGVFGGGRNRPAGGGCVCGMGGGSGICLFTTLGQKVKLRASKRIPYNCNNYLPAASTWQARQRTSAHTIVTVATAAVHTTPARQQKQIVQQADRSHDARAHGIRWQLDVCLNTKSSGTSKTHNKSSQQH